MGDKSKGLYDKFTVARTDGQSEQGKKHDGCNYFVLDLNHDPFAYEAVRVYAQQCRREYPLLANDLISKLMELRIRELTVKGLSHLSPIDNVRCNKGHVHTSIVEARACDGSLEEER